MMYSESLIISIIQLMANDKIRIFMVENASILAGVVNKTISTDNSEYVSLIERLVAELKNDDKNASLLALIVKIYNDVFIDSPSYPGFPLKTDPPTEMDNGAETT